MENKIKYKIIILYQIIDDGHIEYVFRLSEKKNPNHFTDFSARYSSLLKFNEYCKSEYQFNDFPSFPGKIYLFNTENKLNKRLQDIQNYFNNIFNEDKFYKIDYIKKWLKNRFKLNNKEKEQEENNQIFEKNYNNNENDNFLDLITFDYVDDENIGKSIQKKFNDNNFNNSNYISIPKGNDDNFKHLMKNETNNKYEIFLLKELTIFIYNCEKLKSKYSIDIIRKDFKI